MCGIAGYIDFGHKSDEQDLREMIDSLKHRGPDDSGVEVFSCGDSKVGLSHARLSIIDLSHAGHQPMTRNGLSIVFNGEIYNYKEVRAELIKLGHSFVSDSDTEVILCSFQEWGTDCVKRFIGMFAFVVIDKTSRKAYFFRDRVGVKPLFIYRNNDLLLFASELKAFHKHSGFTKEVDPSVLRDFFDLGYVNERNCIFKKVTKVKPGTFLEYSLEDRSIVEKCYWNPQDYFKGSKNKLTYNEAKDELHNLMKSAFKYRMVSDVPVGVFLSGGYDSTAVAAILQSDSSKTLKTYTIGFDSGNNEAPFASKTAKILGTDHHEYICSSEEAKEIIPELPYYYDEPFGDSSAIPTVLVSRFAKKHVTVALSADGGDELFAGYDRYALLEKYYSIIESFPNKMGNLTGALLNASRPFLSEAKKHQIESFKAALSASNAKNKRAILYDAMQRMPNSISTELLLNSENRNSGNIAPDIIDYKELPLLNDFTEYLPGDILTKVDRATMSVALEGREPFLDHRIFEFAASLPYDFKSGNGQTKRILKDIVHGYVPEQEMNRPKSGFSIPLSNWFKSDLKSLLFDTLKSSDTGMYLNENYVSKVLEDFEGDKLHYKPLIWKLLMFSLWQKKWG